MLSVLLPLAAAAPIVNGAPEPGFPSTVSLGVPWGDSAQHICTGNLITPLVVLSAAHCSDDIPVEAVVEFGRAFFGEDITDPDHVLELADATGHPDFAINDSHPLLPFSAYDVAVVVLDEPAPVEATPIRLEEITRDLIGVELVSVGYGATSSAGGGSGIKRSADLILGDLQDQHIIAYTSDSPSGGQICSGDSGGPQFVLEGERWVEWAIHSFGDSECLYSSGSTRTDLMGEWILDQVEAVHGSRDLCEINAWYDDGLCDAFCDAVDPDCVEGADDTGLDGGDRKGRCSSAPAGASGWLALLGFVALARRRR